MGFFISKFWYILGVCIVVLLAEAYVYISLPAQTHADTNPPNDGNCEGWVEVNTSEFGACGTSNYGANYHITNIAKKDITVVFHKESWYCTNPSPHDGQDNGRLSCRGDLHSSDGSTPIAEGGAADIAVNGFTNQPMMCGSQQTDFSFDVWHNGLKICSYGSPSVTYGWSFCSTGQSCTPVPPPPTIVTQPPSPMPTVTVTTTPIPPSPSPIVTVMPPPPTIITPPPVTPAPVIIQGGTTQEQTQTQNNNQNVTVTVGSSSTATPAAATEQTITSASVAPAPTASQLPSTGPDSTALLFLGSLFPLGLKLRRMG